MTDRPLLEVNNLRTRFETDRGSVQAVDGITFEIQKGEIFGIVGESGSGKSVTARSIMRLVESPGIVEADSILFEDEDLLQLSEKRMRSIRGGEISMIFQDPGNSLNPIISVGEQIAESARHHTNMDESTSFLSEMKRKYVTGTPEDANSWHRAIQLMKDVRIPDPEKRARQYPHQLSGGMRQRVMIAQALAGDPKLIIADEPTTALDTSTETQILDLLQDLANSYGVSVLLITHDLGVIRETSDRALVMYAGELMERAGVDELFENPKHPYTRGLLDSAPRISQRREQLATIEGTVPDLLDKPPGCPFRNRCPKAFERCDEPLIEHTVGSPEHTVFCHLYEGNPRVDSSDLTGSRSKSVAEEND